MIKWPTQILNYRRQSPTNIMNHHREEVSLAKIVFRKVGLGVTEPKSVGCSSGWWLWLVRPITNYKSPIQAVVQWWHSCGIHRNNYAIKTVAVINWRLLDGTRWRQTENRVTDWDGSGFSRPSSGSISASRMGGESHKLRSKGTIFGGCL